MIMSVIMLLTAVVFAVIILVRKNKYHRRQSEQCFKMVPFLVTIPKETGEKMDQGTRNKTDIAREMISSAENMYNAIYAIFKGTNSIEKKVKNFLFRAPHIALEIIASKKEILFYVVVPHDLSQLVEKAITTQYPEATVQRVEEHNIFNETRGYEGVKGGYFWGFKNYQYPIKTYQLIEDEPLDTITNALSMLEEDEGAAIQLLIRPVPSKKMTGIKSIAKKIQKGPDKKGSVLSDVGKELVNPGSTTEKPTPEAYRTTPLEDQMIREIEKKSSKFGFETRIRVVIAAQNEGRAGLLFDQIKSGFMQFSDLSMNGLKLRKDKNVKRLIQRFVFRYFDDKIFDNERFWPKKRGFNLVLSSEELASIFHFPNSLVTTPGIKWLPAKSKEIPVNLPADGIKFAKTQFRGEEEDVKITEYDKMRHVYIIGQTGTGKTVCMKNMMISDILAGNGVCLIDPHGEAVADILKMIPKERAEDVILFDASDTDRPLGLNLFEAKTTEQKDLVIAEAISMLYRLYDPGHQGIMGPRFEHWFRNAALALMADPAGGTFIEVPRIFTDEQFLADKLKYVQDPVVRNFWINEMGQTSDFHKSEVLGWFVGKFGAFMTNTTMRNILGQVESSLNLREIMDGKKILLVNLSKGLIGELNMQLLGMIFISKIQMAAMSRADIPEDQRVNFTLYVDEFQNFVTDNISAILSESRKYKLSMVMANQFIQQLREDIRNAVFGNVGTVISFRIGAEDGDFVEKQFTPEYTARDLINQENLHAVCKMTINGLPSRPFTIIDYFPDKAMVNEQIGKAIKELARQKYGRPRDQVDAELQERMKIEIPQQVPGNLPREGLG
jgi:hypothetical protein